MTRFHELFPTPKPIIGVIHLPPLPGYETSPGLGEVLKKALTDLAALEHEGVDGVLVENEDDRPHRVTATAETVAAMTRVAHEVVHASHGARAGVEILLNDPVASLAVARSSGASFIRTDYLVDRMERPEHGGVMDIDPAGLIEYRARIGARDVLILADIQVKYARLLDRRSLSESAELAAAHGADAIIVTGSTTGEPPARGDVVEAKRGAGCCPVLVGSGLDVANARELLTVADGAIVGTSLKTGAYVDASKVRVLMTEVRALESDSL